MGHRSMNLTYPLPRFHLKAHKGWLNDPNGFCYAFGKYHVFAQSNPFATEWGPMHWAHYVSDDLLSYEYVGDALAPEKDFEKPYGCFSGTSYFDGKRLHLFYTAASEGSQVQCYAYSDDGVAFRKFEGNPVLGGKDLPRGYLVRDFRDPKVIFRNGRWNLLVACRRIEGGSSILLFQGKEPTRLEFASVLLSRKEMIECPDFFFDGSGEGRGALVYSLQFRKGEDPRYYQNGHSTCYLVGKLDLEKGTFEAEGTEREVDQGFDFYALQTCSDGRRNLAIAWQGMWDRNYPSKADGYAGSFVAVREIALQDGRLVQRFVRELDKKAKSHQQIRDFSGEGKIRLQELEGDYVRLRFACEAKEGSGFSFLSDGNGSGIEVSFHPERSALLIKRANMKERIVSLDGSDCQSHYLPLEEGAGKASFDILVDGTNVDILVNGGRHSFSTLFFPRSAERRFYAEGSFVFEDISMDTF